MIVTMFPEPREQAKAIGVYGFVASGGASLGLLLGGVITDAINWHWVFVINLPVGIVVALLTRRLVVAHKGIGLKEGADVPGALLITSGLMLGVYTLLEAGEKGWTSAHTLGLGGLAIALLAVFVLRQSRIATPLMPLRLFRSRNVSGANLVMALLVVGFFGFFFLGALYMQRILGYNPLEVGLAFLPSCIVMGTLSLGFSEKLIMGIGPKAALVSGLVAAAVGLLLFARAPVDGTWVVDVLPVMLLLGIGAGVSFPSLMTLAMSGATPSDAGLASGLINTTTQVGGAIGLAVLATVSTERTNSLLDEGHSTASALNSGYHLAYLIGAVLVIGAIAVALTVIRSVPQAAAEAPEDSNEESALAEVA
jgi:MFS family permease